MPSQPVVVVDASSFRRFNDAGLALKLEECLPGAVISPEVQVELARAPLETCPLLRQIARSPDWPSREALNEGNRRDLLAIAKVEQNAGDHPSTHLGEISSVLLARQIRADLLVMDDETGVKMARFRRIAYLSTADLAAGICISGELTPHEARAVFNASAPGCGDLEWQQALERARAR